MSGSRARVPSPANERDRGARHHPNHAAAPLLRLQAAAGNRALVRRLAAAITTSAPPGVVQRNHAETAAKVGSGTGYNNIATFAIVEYADKYALFGQRGYENARLVGDLLASDGYPAQMDFVYPEGWEQDWNVHAEMLAVAEWLRGNQPKPVDIGASREVCLYCARVLSAYGIGTDGSVVGTEPTKNWVSPWHLDGNDPPEGYDGIVPRYRSNNIDY